MRRKFTADLLLYTASAGMLPHRFRGNILRHAGVVVGSNVLLMAGSRFESHRVVFGDNVFVNSGCYFDAQAPIRIGDETRIGDNVRFITSTHEVGPSKRRAGAGRSAAITIGSGVWIGSGAVILPGVTTGNGCIIGAGAVVTKDCEADSLYVGVPAFLKRSLSD